MVKTKSKKTDIVEVEVNGILGEGIAEKRQALIDDLSPKLLTKTQLKQGNSNTRSRYEQEKGYQANIDEINSLGKQIGCAPIGLAHLRK